MITCNIAILASSLHGVNYSTVNCIRRSGVETSEGVLAASLCEQGKYKRLDRPMSKPYPSRLSTFRWYKSYSTHGNIHYIATVHLYSSGNIK